MSATKVISQLGTCFQYVIVAKHFNFLVPDLHLLHLKALLLINHMTSSRVLRVEWAGKGKGLQSRVPDMKDRKRLLAFIIPKEC